VSEKINDIYVASVHDKLNTKGNTQFSQRSSYMLLTIYVVQVTGIYFKAVTVSAIHLGYSSNSHGTCQEYEGISPTTKPIQNTNSVTEFLTNEEFHHKASKNTDVSSNGKSTTDIISLTLGGLHHTQRSGNSKRHIPQ
jgi:hypothetical protein